MVTYKRAYKNNRGGLTTVKGTTMGNLVAISQASTDRNERETAAVTIMVTKADLENLLALLEESDAELYDPILARQKY